MSSVHASLDDLLQRELVLSSSQISQGSKSHNYITGLLNNRNTIDKSFPYLIDTFLSGSYNRGTKIFPLDDIDVMIVLDGTGLFPISSGIVLDATINGSGEESNPILQYLGVDGFLDSRKVIDLFWKALNNSHKSSTVSKDGQAVNIWLDSYGMGIDVVPCFHVIPNNSEQDFYYIPRGKNASDWMMTNPKIDLSISDNLHNIHNNLFKGVVRLVKYWNRVSNKDRLRSYHIETMVWHAFDDYAEVMETYETGLARFFIHASAILESGCPDKTSLGGPVDTYLSEENRNLSIVETDLALEILRVAYLDPVSNDNIRLDAWRELFGDKFLY